MTESFEGQGGQDRTDKTPKLVRSCLTMDDSCGGQICKPILDQPLALADMASWVNLSPYHFARLFRASFGCPPYQYVQEQRLVRARDMLRKRSHNITAIALTCGFNDPSQFSRAFKSRFGVTPSGFRAEAYLNH